MLILLTLLPSPTEIYTLSLHDALPICDQRMRALIPAEREPITPFVDRIRPLHAERGVSTVLVAGGSGADRKSTRLNSSHVAISYAVFCLKKKKKTRE